MPPLQNAAPSFPITRMIRGGLGLILTQVLAFCSARLVSNALGSEQYGRFGLALVFGVYSSQFIQWGLDPLVSRELARAGPEDSAEILAASLRQKQLASVFALLAGIAAALLWQHTDERLIVLLGVVDGIILSYTMPSAFDVRGRTPLYFLFTSGRQALYLISILVLLYVFSVRATPGLFLVLHACAIVPQIAAEWLWIRRSFGALNMKNAFAKGRQLWLDAAPIAIALCAWQVSIFLGPPMMEFFGRTSQLGELVVSNQLALAIFSLGLVPGRMIQVWLAALTPGSAQFRRAMLRYMLVFALAGAVMAFIADHFSEKIVTLFFGEQFRAAAPLFAIDVWRIVGAFSGLVLSGALICENRLRAYGACQVAALAAAIAVAVFAVPRFGAAGAVLAVVMSQCVFSSLALLLLLTHSSPQAIVAMRGDA